MSGFELKTSRLILRDFNQIDIPDYLALYENPGIVDFILQKTSKKIIKKVSHKSSFQVLSKFPERIIL